MVQRYRLFAAGAAVALLLGGASPAMAKPAKGPKAPKAAKTPKVKSGRVNGGGIFAGKAGFSVQARAGNPKNKGHFNYTSSDGTFKVRCKGIEFHPVAYVAPAPATARITGECWEGAGRKSRTPISLDATFVDKGETGDEATITLTRPNAETPVNETGVITEGGIHIR